MDLQSTMCEILAPCGDKNTAIIAINSGADAIYLGMLAFSAREGAVNFTFEDLRETVRYAALFGVKVYVALNTLVKDSELKSFLDFVVGVWNSGADAIILQDIFLGKYIKENCPEIVLHLSTQAGVCNVYGAQLARDYGFSRVILARETSIADIREIAKIIETEVFVQGALCTCFSGQCYFSSFIGGNSGNRGRCKQPCRKLYSLNRTGYDNLAYRLSLSDLSVGHKIHDLIVAGVTSFKIEGRMRRPEYVAASVKYYKDILDGKEGDLSAVKRTFNRGNYTCGLAFGQDKNFISSAVQGHLGEFVGIIDVNNTNYVCHSTYKSDKGDCFKVLRNGKELGGAVFYEKVRDGFTVKSDRRLKNGDKLFITTDVNLNEQLLSYKRLIDLHISANFCEGDKPCIIVNGIPFTGEEKLTTALNRVLTYEDIINCFKKVDGKPFNIIYDDIVIKGEPYLGMSALNALRREVYGKYCDIVSNKGDRNIHIQTAFPEVNCAVNSKKAVIANDFDGINADIYIYKPYVYFTDHSRVIKSLKGEKYLYMPPYMTSAELEKLKPYVMAFDGIYCEGIYGILYAKEINKKLFAGTGFNITNSISATYCRADYCCVSKELTLKEALPLCKDNSFYLSGGNIKVMDLIYCPFSKNCKTCDKRHIYTLTDEQNRQFPLRRYETESCLFELYNCAVLKCVEEIGTGSLYDFTNGISVSDKITKGHTRLRVL